MYLNIYLKQTNTTCAKDRRKTENTKTTFSNQNEATILTTMLRREIVRNFIHFQDQTKFEFHPGPNFLIGQNCSGKSSVFEAIRRCLGVRQNTSFSNPHFKDDISYSTCIFDIEDAQKAKGKLLSTAIQIPPTYLAGTNNTVYIKACFETIAKSFKADLIKETNTGLVNDTLDQVATEETIIQLCENIVEGQTDDFNLLVDTIIQGVNATILDEFNRNNELTGALDTDCETTLQRYLDATTVFTFPVRGIGPCQWSWSPMVHNSNKTEIYEIAEERCEILRWYLSGKENGTISKEDQSVVEEYFSIISNDCGLQFRFERDGKSTKTELVAFYSNVGKRCHNEEEPKSFPVLKVPGGFLEAMDTSILLGVSKFKTVCLEEPEKGMNPQMIERMRDLVLQRIQNKTVLLTSHHPYFLCHWTVPRLYIFKPSENVHGTLFSVYFGSEIEPDDPDTKSSRIITSDHFAAIFFAKRMMFVEGKGDYLFLATLKQLLLTDDELALQLIEHDLNVFRVFLCSMHVIHIDGETNKKRLNNLCIKIGMERYFLLDYDAIEDDEKTADTFLEEFNLDNAEFGRVLQDVSILEKEGLFVWNKLDVTDRRSGKIEDAFIELTQRHMDLKEFFNNNNVFLQYKPVKKLKNRNKLFRHKKLTDENITNVVRKVAETCVQDKENTRSKPTEMQRFITFLFKISQPQSEPYSQ